MTKAPSYWDWKAAVDKNGSASNKRNPVTGVVTPLKGGATVPPSSLAPVITTADTVDANAAKVAQALLPYMSPTDAQTQATLFGLNYTPPPTSSLPNTINGQVRDQYLSQSRATQALNALAGISGAAPGQTGVNLNNMGPGYTFLTQAIGLLKQYGGADANNGMSRKNYNAFSSALTDLVNQTKADKSVDEYTKILPYINMAQAFLTPNLGGIGSLAGQDKVSGQTFPGLPAPQFNT